MLFEESFNEVCKFPDFYVDYVEDVSDIEWKIKEFAEEYPAFKKEYGLENLYFSRVIHVEHPSDMITEVYYKITDLYLTFLDANGILPMEDGARIETTILKEQYIYNTEKEWLFRDSMRDALKEQGKYLDRGIYKVFSSSLFVGITERIKLSNSSNGLPGMICDRIPMTYDDLII